MDQASPYRGAAALLTAQQAAELLNVPASWIYAETRAERIPFIPLGRYRRYDADALEQWWRDRARGPWRDRGAAAAQARNGRHRHESSQPPRP